MHGSSRRHTPPSRSLRLASLLPVAGTLILLGACTGGEEEAATAPYVSQEPGTVYHYAGVTNTITAVDGWRTRFTDNAGREGSRVGLFISENPAQPTQVDSADLAALWPLRVGKETEMKVNRGDEVWRYEFRVTGTQKVTVPAGEFDTFVVQAVETPELVRDPAKSYSAMYTWWYAPEIGNVVKFKTSYLSGPPAGRVYESELEKVERTTGQG